MRMAADRIHRVRRGEITATVRRRTRRHCTYRVGAKRAIQKVEDVRRVEYDQIHARTGEPCVYYDPKVETLRERIEITAVRPSLLDELRPEEIAASGFPDPDDMLDYFRAELGCGPRALVWVIRFAMVSDESRFMANQQGTADPPQYVASTARAMDDAEAVDDDTLAGFIEANHARFATLKPNQTAEDEARRLERELKEVRKRAARTGVDCSLQLAAIRHQIDEIRRNIEAKAA